MVSFLGVLFVRLMFLVVVDHGLSLLDFFDFLLLLADRELVGRNLLSSELVLGELVFAVVVSELVLLFKDGDLLFELVLWKLVLDAAVLGVVVADVRLLWLLRVVDDLLQSVLFLLVLVLPHLLLVCVLEPHGVVLGRQLDVQLRFLRKRIVDVLDACVFVPSVQIHRLKVLALLLLAARKPFFLHVRGHACFLLVQLCLLLLQSSHFCSFA